MNKLPQLKGFSFPSELIQEYKKSEKLLSLRISLVPRHRCNLNCIYCYTTDPELSCANAKPLTFKQITNAINEAIAMGIRSVVSVGDGEPLLYEHFKNLAEYLNERGITFVTFSNLTLITKELAEFLYKNNVSVIGKCDGPEKIQDFLSGKGSYSKIQTGLKNLLDAGYGKDENILRLGLEAVICSINYDLIPNLWREMRNKNIFPSFERATLMGSAHNHQIKEITPDQTRELMEKLRDIDEKEYGYQWPAPYGPIPAHQCYLFYAGTHLNVYGGVCPCPELPPIDYYPDHSLSQILHSEKYSKIRNVEKYIQGKCQGCAFLNVCYGCRSKAYHNCGSIFGEDPYCPVGIK